jgi:hypothetical protein
MTKRHVLTIVSALLALGLIVALFHTSGLEVARVARLVLATRPGPFLVLLFMAAAHVMLAGEKWRLVEQTMSNGATRSRRLCFGLTALGGALGQVLPIQVATALSRSLGSQVLAGSGLWRSAVGTVFEQSFDFLIVAFIGIESIWCVRTGDLSSFVVSASALVIAALLVAGPVAKLAKIFMRRLAPPRSTLAPRVGHIAHVLLSSGLVDDRLVRRLLALSALRFLVLWGMAAATTAAVGLDIPPLELAACLPLVMLATALSLTPAGIGVNEWTFAAALTALGTPLDVAGEWALANRILVAAASLVVGGVGAMMLRMSPRNGALRSPRYQRTDGIASPVPQDSPAM